MNHQWTKEETLIEFKKWVNEKKWKGFAHLAAHFPRLKEELMIHFPQVEEILRECGLPSQSYNQQERWTDEKALEYLKEWVDTGKWQGSTHLQQRYCSLYGTLQYRFDNIEAAFQLIGYDYHQYKNKNKWTNEIILSIVKEQIEKGEWKGSAYLQKEDCALYSAIQRYFKTPKAVFEILRVDMNLYQSRRVWTNEKILSELKEWIDSGKWKGSSRLVKENPALYGMIMKRYESLRKAFETLGLNYEEYKQIKEPKWNEENIKRELKEWIQSGKWQGSSHLQKEHTPLFGAIRSKYGHLNAAFTEIGLDYEEYKYTKRLSKVNNEKKQ